MLLKCKLGCVIWTWHHPYSLNLVPSSSSVSPVITFPTTSLHLLLPVWVHFSHSLWGILCHKPLPSFSPSSGKLSLNNSLSKLIPCTFPPILYTLKHSPSMFLSHIFILISEFLLHCLVIIVTISLSHQTELAESGIIVFGSISCI